MEVLVEVLPNIQACNVFITSSDDRSLCQEIVSYKNSCSIKDESGQSVILRFPRGTTLLPGKLTNVSQDGSHITARAQLDERTSLLSSLSADLLSNMGPLTPDASSPWQEALQDSLVTTQCKQCRGILLKDVRFRRVLPLPSVDWEQASEGWFCHLHGDDGEKLKPSSLQPASSDCFYSELHFLVHRDVTLEWENSDVSGGELMCSGCQTSVGVRNNQSAKLWTHSVMWVRSADRQILFAKDVSGILLSLIENIDKDNFGVNCRLVLKASPEEEPAAAPEFLYLVTMNTNQKLLVPEGANGLSSVVGESMSPAPTENGDSAAGNDLPSEKRLRAHREDPSEIVLRKVYAVKLLYLNKRGEDDLTGSWVDDVNIHILPCSKSFLAETRNLLESSAVCLPQGMRQVDGMHVGYILKNS